MKLNEKVVELMADPKKKYYAYVSKSKDNMNGLNAYVSENVDFSETKVTIYVVHPIGVTAVPKTLDGVFADAGSTTEAHLRRFLNIRAGAFLTWVDATTTEIQDGTSNTEDTPPVPTVDAGPNAETESVSDRGE
jgi:hypothetical protein